METSQAVPQNNPARRGLSDSRRLSWSTAAAGSGGDVNTRPDSRDAPHLFGLGLKEMLADDHQDLRAIRSDAELKHTLESRDKQTPKQQGHRLWLNQGSAGR
jgi:hypothetical protein